MTATVTPAERLAIELGAPIGDRDGTKLVPMLCDRDQSGERVLTREGFLFELKLDGVRILADKRGDRVTLGYRKVRSATESYPEIAEAVAKLSEERVLLDGEVVAFDEQGRPDFQRLGTRIQTRAAGARRAAVSVPVAYVVFDVLVVGDRDVTGLPIEARKAILERIVGDHSKAGGHLRLHPTFTQGTELFRLCRDHQLEGVVAKRAGSPYRPDDRSADWIKVKCELDADLVVVGWAEGEGKRARLGALDLGVYDGDRLVIRGSVGSGLDEDVIDELLARLGPLEVERPVAEGKLRYKRGRHYVRPEIVVSVRHMGFSEDGVLRFPVFRGLRDDLTPHDCTSESLGCAKEAPATDRRRMRATAVRTAVLPDGTTKGALCSYYEAVAPSLLPHVRGRISPPLRSADRLAKLWPLPEWTPSWVHTAVAPRGREELRGVVIDDVDTLYFLIEAGGASFLLTSAREVAPKNADFIALRIAGGHAADVALRTKALVEQTGLTAFLKTNGAPAGTGVDVLVPIGDVPSDAAHLLTALFERLLGGVAAASGATITGLDAPIAPYAVVLPVASGRKATASMPLDWSELDDLADVAALTLDECRERTMKQAVDPLHAMVGKVDKAGSFARAVACIEQMVAAGDYEKG